MKLGSVKYDKRDGARGWVSSINRKSVTLVIDGVKRRVPTEYITRFCQTGTGEGGRRWKIEWLEKLEKQRREDD